MQVIRGHRRLDRWNLRHLMPLGLGILSRQGMLAAGTALRRDRDHDIDRLDWQQRPRLSLMTELPAGPPATGLTVGTLVQSG
jgi:hypothetical protein